MTKKKLISKLDTFLKPIGFVRQGNSWNLCLETIIEVIDIQISGTGEAYTLNAGVLDKAVYEVVWGEPALDFVEQPQCTVYVRAGELIDGHDKWWILENFEQDSLEIQHVIKEITGFLKCVSAREKMVHWLLGQNVLKKNYPLPIVNLAILQALTGQMTSALFILSEQQAKLSGPWKDRISEVLKRLI